jgi:predicted Zn finger-like uncharacterized protein
MQIACPKCTTSYRIAETAIGANGRSVHCVRCDHIWRVESLAIQADTAKIESDEAAFRAELGKPEAVPPPPMVAADEPSPLPEAASATPDGSSLDVPGTPSIPVELGTASAFEPAETAAETPVPSALSDIPIPVEDAPPLVPAAGDETQSAQGSQIENQREDIETVAARRARSAAKRRHGRFRISLSVAVAAMLVVCAALIGLRKDVVRHAPQLASLYASIGLPVNLRGLEFAEVKIGNEIRDGVPVLVIEGAVVNKVTMPVDVPRLRFALRNASGAELYSWTAQPGQPVLEPGARLPFRSRLASPPAESHDVQVRFFTLRDAVAGLH